MRWYSGAGDRLLGLGAGGAGVTTGAINRMFAFSSGATRTYINYGVGTVAEQGPTLKQYVVDMRSGARITAVGRIGIEIGVDVVINRLFGGMYFNIVNELPTANTSSKSVIDV